MLYLRGKGKYDREYAKLWRRLVPKSGKAATLQGELVRAIGRLASEAYRNGNINWDAGFRAFVNFLHRYLCDRNVFDARTVTRTRKDLKDIGDFGNGSKNLEYLDGEDVYDRVTDRVVEWCRAHPDPLALPKGYAPKR